MITEFHCHLYNIDGWRVSCVELLPIQMVAILTTTTSSILESGGLCFPWIFPPWLFNRSLGLNEIEGALPANSAKVLLESNCTFINPIKSSNVGAAAPKQTRVQIISLHEQPSTEWLKLLFQAAEKGERPAGELLAISSLVVISHSLNK
ncbi:unnamed protein product [Linum tenue]|uniref:Uncharacterized protein n=1 Tax=Linum tenue TaxID=586396 RepID=A0AAV0NLJ5_9ROSI|nr:unnamed protein product [Linum tenue]